jgi:hypothetical protein
MWSASIPCRFTSGKAGGRYGEEKSLALPGIKSGPSSPQPGQIEVKTRERRHLNMKGSREYAE